MIMKTIELFGNIYEEVTDVKVRIIGKMIKHGDSKVI